MSLKEYRRKRDFKKTPEPEKSRLKKKNKLIYAIQRHDASHLHFDLRLEEEGVLRSWAIPKEPPLEEGVKRLAVETEDHPLGYDEFEGLIPEGQYGAGRVEIWDKGYYEILESGPEKKIIKIQGKKLRGRYALIKIRNGQKGEKNWLFFKLKEGDKK